MYADSYTHGTHAQLKHSAHAGARSHAQVAFFGRRVSAMSKVEEIACGAYHIGVVSSSGEARQQATCHVHVPYRMTRVMRHTCHTTSGLSRPAGRLGPLRGRNRQRAPRALPLPVYTSATLPRMPERRNAAYPAPSNGRAPSGGGIGGVVQAYMWGDGAEGAARRQPHPIAFVVAALCSLWAQRLRRPRLRELHGSSAV